MNKKIKYIICLIIVIASVLIISGLVFVLKDLMAQEDLLNMPDDPSYHRVVFDINGATSIEYKVKRCKIEDGLCYVTLPEATRKNGVVLGYSDNKNDLEAKYNIGEDIALMDSMTLYVISYQKNTLMIDENGVDYLEKNELSCVAYNSAKTCKVLVPKYNKIGYENKGYSTSSQSQTGYIVPNTEYELSKDTILYPIYSTSSRHQRLNISKVYTFENSFIEIEKGCNEKIYAEFLGYLAGINKYAQFLLVSNKITFITEKTFDSIWSSDSKTGSTYVGMNYGPKGLRSIDIRCGDTAYNDYYATMVHEMAHSWDFYYAYKLGNYISSQNDIINLYNKYRILSDRPFRDNYSYSMIEEFFADMMRYYYFKYYVPRYGFSSLDYPLDIKETLEKYICITKNNYDESKCS